MNTGHSSGNSQNSSSGSINDNRRAPREVPSSSAAINVRDPKWIMDQMRASVAGAGVDMVFLPLDDPRSVAMSKFYVPGDPHPYNLFFSVGGRVTLPVLSPQFLHRLGSGPLPLPPSLLNFESDEVSSSGQDLPNVAETTRPQPQQQNRAPQVAGKKIKKKKKTFKCQECGKVFDTPKKLSDHGAAHKRGTAFWCKFCDRDFAKKGSLVNHLITVHSKKTPDGKK